MNQKHIIITTTILLLICSSTATAWIPDYNQRIEITVNNGAGATLTDYQFNFTNDTNVLVAAGHMNANGSDCRITDSSDNLIPFWNEGEFNTTDTKIWVNATTLTVGDNIFYMYYGNTAANSVANGTNTFEFFDDFSGDDSQWTTSGGTWAIIDLMVAATKYSDTWVQGLGGVGAPDELTLGRPSIIYDDNKYKMWYSGYDSSNIFSVCYSYSTDGIIWTKHGTAVLEITGSGWESTHVYYPYVVKDGSTYHMWYSGFDGTNIKIGYANSTDGISWTRGTHNPVIVLGSGGAWDDYHVYAASVINESGTWKMWYTGSSDGSDAAIGYATSTDPDDNWAKYGSTAVMSGVAGWEDSRVSNADIKKVDTVYHMYYSGKSVNTGNIGYANSTDGISWTRGTHNPVIGLGSGGAWDDTGVYAPGVYWNVSESRFWIWYSGQGTTDHPKRQGLAYHSPTLGNKYQQSDISSSHKFAYGSTDYDNRIMEAIVSVTGGTEPTRAAGIVCRYTDSDNTYILQIRPSGIVYLWKKDGGAWTVLDSTAMTIMDNVDYKLKMVFNGTSLDGYVDDVLKVSTTDSIHSTGKVGLQSYAGSALYADVRIRKHTATEPTSSLGAEENVTGDNNTYRPPDPTNLQHTISGSWINYTWFAGSGNITDSYNVSVNEIWYNGSTNTYKNNNIAYGTWANITVWAWNNTNDGTLSLGSVNQNTYLPVGNTYIPPNPLNINNITGSDWVKHLWDVGIGNITNSYNVSVNGVWYNGSTNTYYRKTYTCDGWQNISVWAWNNSYTGTLSLGSVSQNTFFEYTGTKYFTNLKTMITDIVPLLSNILLLVIAYIPVMVGIIVAGFIMSVCVSVFGKLKRW